MEKQQDQVTETTVKPKTGATPEPVEEQQGSRVVHQVAELKLMVVDYTDGHGERMTRPVIVGPADQVSFLDDKAVGKTAQTWLTEKILKVIRRG